MTLQRAGLHPMGYFAAEVFSKRLLQWALSPHRNCANPYFDCSTAPGDQETYLLHWRPAQMSPESSRTVNSMNQDTPLIVESPVGPDFSRL